MQLHTCTAMSSADLTMVANIAFAPGHALLAPRCPLWNLFFNICKGGRLDLRIKMPEENSQKGGSILYTCYPESLFVESKVNFHFVWEFSSAWKYILHGKLFEVIWFCLHIQIVEGLLSAYMHKTFALFWQTYDMLQSLLNVAQEWFTNYLTKQYKN